MEDSTMFNLTDANSTDYNDTITSLVNATSPGNSTTADDPAKPCCGVVFGTSLLLFFLLALFFLCTNKWHYLKHCLLFVLMSIIQVVVRFIRCITCCCRRRPGKPTSDMLEPLELPDCIGKGQLNVIDLVEAPASFEMAQQAALYKNMENRALYQCGVCGRAGKKVVHQENVLVHRENEEKIMNTIEEEEEVQKDDTVNKELLETDVHVGSLDKEKINKFSIEWEMMKILDRTNKMEKEDEEKRLLELGMDLKTGNVENIMTKKISDEERESVKTTDEEGKIQKTDNNASDLQKGSAILTKQNDNVESDKPENLPTKIRCERELMIIIEGVDMIKKNVEGKDNLAFDLQEEPATLKNEEKIQMKSYDEMDAAMEEFENELEKKAPKDIDNSVMGKESQRSPSALSKRDGKKEKKASEESKMLNIILEDSQMEENEGCLATGVDLERGLAKPTDGTADGQIDETVVSAETSNKEAKPSDAFFQVYLGSEAYNQGFYI